MDDQTNQTDQPDLPKTQLGERQKAQRQAAFLRAFSTTGIIKTAAEIAGVTRRIVYEWKKDEGFLELYEEAEADAADLVEQEMHRRAVKGVEEPVTFQGQPTMLEDPETGEKRMFTLTKYSDSLLLSLIKARKPTQFRDNLKADVNLTGGATGVLVVPAAIDPEAWAKAAEEQQAKFAGNSGEEKATK